MDAEKLPFLLFGCLPTFLFFATLYSWWKDYQFYKINKWDYTKDSGREIRYGAAYVKLGKMSNEEKMKRGYPKFLVLAFIFAAIAFSPLYFSA